MTKQKMGRTIVGEDSGFVFSTATNFSVEKLKTQKEIPESREKPETPEIVREAIKTLKS